MTEILDRTDRRILDLIQRNFPLVSRPFNVIAERVATTEDDVMERLARLKQAGVVREICAVFDAARLGYRSTLAAMAVVPARIEQVAAIVSAHPGVSHNYERTHRFNLWFTLTISGDRSVEEEVGRLARKARVDDFLVLPVLRRFKIGVDFDLGTRGEDEQSVVSRQPSAVSDQPSAISHQGSDDSNQKSRIGSPKSKIQNRKSRIEKSSSVTAALSLPEKAVIRILQYDLPLEPRAFARLAARISMAEDEVLSIAANLLATSVMRRIGAILRHRQVGYLANAMVCWIIPSKRIERAGKRAARERAVSHCYERPTFPPRWPYNLMTMIHGRSEDEVRKVVRRLHADLRPTDHAILFSLREFKKQRVHYFEDK